MSDKANNASINQIDKPVNLPLNKSEALTFKDIAEFVLPSLDKIVIRSGEKKIKASIAENIYNLRIAQYYSTLDVSKEKENETISNETYNWSISNTTFNYFLKVVKKVFLKRSVQRKKSFNEKENKFIALEKHIENRLSEHFSRLEIQNNIVGPNYPLKNITEIRKIKSRFQFSTWIAYDINSSDETEFAKCKIEFFSKYPNDILFCRISETSELDVPNGVAHFINKSNMIIHPPENFLGPNFYHLTITFNRLRGESICYGKMSVLNLDKLNKYNKIQPSFKTFDLRLREEPFKIESLSGIASLNYERDKKAHELAEQVKVKGYIELTHEDMFAIYNTYKYQIQGRLLDKANPDDAIKLAEDAKILGYEENDYNKVLYIDSSKEVKSFYDIDADFIIQILKDISK